MFLVFRKNKNGTAIKSAKRFISEFIYVWDMHIFMTLERDNLKQII